MRGRRDELSNEYYCFTVETLKNYLSISENETGSSYQRLLEQKEYLESESILKFRRDKGVYALKRHPIFFI